MLIIKHTEETTASPRDIWAIWEDVSNWNTWDHGIEYSSLDGPFAVGTTGKLKPVGGPVVHTKLTHVEPLKSFVDESRLPLGRIIFSHTLSVNGSKTLVTTQIEMKGLSAFFFAYVIGRKMKKHLPREMKRMIEQAESGTKKRA